MVKLTDSNGNAFYLNAIHVLSVSSAPDGASDHTTTILCVEETTFEVREAVDDVARVVSSALRSIGR